MTRIRSQFPAVFLRSLVFTIAAAMLAAVSPAQISQSKIVRADLPKPEIDRIVKKFTDNEFMFRQALMDYVFNRSAEIQTIGMGGQVTGVYRRDSFMTFTGDGRRFERITSGLDAYRDKRNAGRHRGPRRGQPICSRALGRCGIQFHVSRKGKDRRTRSLRF